RLDPDTGVVGWQILPDLVPKSGRVVGPAVQGIAFLGALLDQELGIRRALGVVAGVDPVGDAVALVGDFRVRRRFTHERQRRVGALQTLDRPQYHAGVHGADNAQDGGVRDSLCLEGSGRVRLVLVVPYQQVNLGALNPAFGVPILDRQLDGLERPRSD